MTDDSLQQQQQCSQSAPCSNRPIKCVWLSRSVAVTGALVALHIPTGGREPLC